MLTEQTINKIMKSLKISIPEPWFNPIVIDTLITTLGVIEPFDVDIFDRLVDWESGLKAMLHNDANSWDEDSKATAVIGESWLDSPHIKKIMELLQQPAQQTINRARKMLRENKCLS